MNQKSRKFFSFFLFALLCVSIFFSLPFLNFSPEVPKVYADSTNSGFNFFTEAIDISQLADFGVYTDMDVSAHVPVGTTGVVVEFIQSTQSDAIGLRAKGSTDDWYGIVIVQDGHKYGYVKLDSNRLFQQKIDSTWTDTWLVGYTDSAVTWFVDAKDYSIVPTGSWETIDLSTDVPSGATGVIIALVDLVTSDDGGVRHPDSTDAFFSPILRWEYVLVGVNSAREIEGYIETTDMDHFLVAYTTSPVSFNVNWDDVSLGVGGGGWTDIDVQAETSVDANGVFIYMTFPAQIFGCIKEKDAVEDRSADSKHYGFTVGACGLDASQLLEGKISSTDVDFYVVGYTEIGDIYPNNEDVVSTSEFAQNSTIGWINVSVSHANGYGNISSVIATINTTGGELCNLTWIQTGNLFEKTYDPINMTILFSDESESSLGDIYCNISFKVAFRRGSVGYCDVTVFTTGIDDLTASDTFSDEFYLSDFQRATGLQWSKDLGYFSSTGMASVTMDDSGKYVAVGTHQSGQIMIYNRTGDLLKTFDINLGQNSSVSTTRVEFSGDGRYIVFHNFRRASFYNLSMLDWENENLLWSEQSTTTLAQDIDVNYNGSIVAVTTTDYLKLYDTTGQIWNTTTMDGSVDLPHLRSVSVSRTGDTIAVGTSPTGVTWVNASLFVWNSGSTDAVWVWNSSISDTAIWDVEVNDVGTYICSIVSTNLYASYIIIHSSSSNLPLSNELIKGNIKTTTDSNTMDFVAQLGKDIFYVVAVGEESASDSVIKTMSYNLTSDLFINVWNYTLSNLAITSIELSSIIHNDKYYLSISGEGGVYYWDTSSNSTIWTYFNATQDLGGALDINRDGNRFFAPARNIVGSSQNFVQYFGYEGDIPFFVGSANITNMEGCGNWIFSDERFYQVEGKFTHVIDATMLSHVGLRFTDETNTFYLWYNVSARSEPNIDAYGLVISPQFDLDKEPGIINPTLSSASYDVGDLTVVWKFWPTMFSFDSMDIDVYAYMNDTVGNEIDWTIEESDLFHLYVLGGFTNSTNSGDAGQYQGRTPLDLYAGDNSSVLVEVYYRKLSHVHLQYGIWMPDAYVEDEYNYTVDIGMDFCFYGDDYWYKGWKTQIQQHGGGSTATNRWINYTTEHYRFNPTGGGSYEPMRQGKMYAYWEGYLGGNDQYQLYTDLWFSASNRSRMWGVRVNSVYHGMVDNALFGLPWLFGSNWRTLDQNFTDLTYKDRIMDYPASLDAWGDMRFTSEIVMCRFWMNLTRPDTGRSYYVRVQGYTSQDFDRKGSGQFKGINDPPIIPTVVPDIDSGGGLFGSLFGWLMESAKFIVEGLTIGIMSGIGVFVSFLDVLFGLAGWEGGASTIASWIGNSITWIIFGFNYLKDIMVSLFSIMATWLVLGIQRFIGLSSGLVLIYDNLVWIYSQANAGWVDASEFINPLLPLLPLAFFIWLLNSRDVYEMFGKISLCWNFVRSIAGFFIQIGQYTIQLISTIIEAIQW